MKISSSKNRFHTGAKYTRQYTSKGPFQDISIDPLNYHLIKPFEGSRSKVKNYPMIVRCLNSDGLEVLLMEGMETTSTQN